MAVILGLITAIGPSAIHFYLPAFPAIGRELAVSSSALQQTMVSFFIGLAAGQIFYGPLSDRVGRKPPLYVGLAIFLFGSILCAIAPDAEILTLARFIQGLGACAGIAIARAIVRDLHTGPEAASLMAIVALVSSVSPTIAPLFGSMLLTVADWRAIFWVIAGTIVVLTLLVYFSLPETNPPAQQSQEPLTKTFASYWQVAKMAEFRSLALSSGLVMSTSFAFLAGAPSVLAAQYGFDSWHISGLMVACGIAQVGGAQIVPRMMKAVGTNRLVAGGFALMIAAAAGLVASVNQQASPVYPSIFFALGYLAVGILLTPLTILLLQPLKHSSGTASSLLGIVQLCLGASVSALVSLINDGTLAPVALCIVAASLLASACFARAVQVSRRRPYPL